MMGKRFLFAIIAVICVSVTCVILKYPPEVYKVIVLAITGIFTFGQTVTDYKKEVKNVKKDIGITNN